MSSENDMDQILNKQFADLREAIDEIQRLKSSGQNVEVKRSAAALMFVALKHSNREVKRNIKSGRDELHAEKLKVDMSRLQLQSLLYDVSHLKKEIIKCQQFKSRDSHLELLSDEEYASKLPSLATNGDEKSEVSSHSNHLHRLECELSLRKDLDNQYKSLLTAKQDLLQDNVNQTQRYGSFAPALRTLLDSTKPLHDALQLTLDVDWKLSSVYKYLPKPLYILFINLQSLQRINSDAQNKFHSEVVGFENEAHMKELLASKQKLGFSVQNGENGSSDNILERLLDPFPLHIRITIFTSDNLHQMELIIRYWGLIKCATVQAQFSSNLAASANAPGDTSFVHDILRHLYPNDFGNEIPIPGIQCELQNLNLTAEECLKHLENNNFGKPFCWLQNMCSIPTVNTANEYVHELNLYKCTREAIARISKRCQSWVELSQQIRGLTYKDIDLDTLKENTAGILSGSLVQWTAITPEDFQAQSSDALNSVSDSTGESSNEITHTFYRAVIVRGSAKMECFIKIFSNYPLEMPLWILCIHWNGCHTSKNSSAIKMMECWTNSLLVKDLEPNHQFLFTQLFRTIYSFDIFLETEGSMQSTLEYNKEKPYLNPFTKRIRMRPYKYTKKGSVYAFKQ
ncbi:THO complex subunit 5 isoform X1 [Drosophila tropicalis]|uniref:THO complex subunit 5 isoform X1 n=2 Tax=Drosophila tropicalis TaxID=46794 RepID=UPI0035AB79CC